MDAKTRAALTKEYKGYSKEELADKLEQAKGFVANPNNATAEELAGAKATVEFLSELTGAKPDDDAAKGDTAEVIELKAQLKAAEAKLVRAGVSPEIEALVAQKIRMGLSREDAMVCARRQVLHDAVVAEHEAVIDAAVAKVNKQFEGKDKRSPEFKEALANAKSEATAKNNTGEKLVTAGAAQ
jgi:hypothetical protein